MGAGLSGRICGDDDGFPTGESCWVAQHVRDSGKKLVCSDTKQEPMFSSAIAEEQEKFGIKTKSLVAVPLCNSAGSFIGVLQAVNFKHASIACALGNLEAMLLEDLGQGVAAALESMQPANFLC